MAGRKPKVLEDGKTVQYTTIKVRLYQIGRAHV